jgi:hypothetical protein
MIPTCDTCRKKPATHERRYVTAQTFIESPTDKPLTRTQMLCTECNAKREDEHMANSNVLASIAYPLTQ